MPLLERYKLIINLVNHDCHPEDEEQYRLLKVGSDCKLYFEAVFPKMLVHENVVVPRCCTMKDYYFLLRG